MIRGLGGRDGFGGSGGIFLLILFRLTFRMGLRRTARDCTFLFRRRRGWGGVSAGGAEGEEEGEEEEEVKRKIERNDTACFCNTIEGSVV